MGTGTKSLPSCFRREVDHNSFHNRTPHGDWAVEVNNEELSAPDLTAAKQLFVDLYDQSKVVVNPFAISAEGDGLEVDFKIIDLGR
ncbi:hypothetical protein BQ8482_340011 [Mesorhizobium delmotii]|uniref:Uncharacterized protein n=1 Tax=Mesorhizobium delmotii TaxID=1631247 RepID=A0A2P9APQ1_9HYPH|nr:hypothetical protein BQ8482_340011 [Mesorhizobium delmotii]